MMYFNYVCCFVNVFSLFSDNTFISFS